MAPSPRRHRPYAAPSPFLAESPPRSPLAPIFEGSGRSEESSSVYNAPGYQDSLYELTFMPEVDMELAALHLSSTLSTGPLQAAPSAGDLAVLAGASSGGYTTATDGESVGGSLHGSGAAAAAIAAATWAPLQRMSSALAAALGAALAALSPEVDPENEDEAFIGAVELPFTDPDATWD